MSWDDRIKMMKELPQTYTIKYDIRDDQLLAVLVEVGDKEEYISKYELDMMIAEYVWKNGTVKKA